LSQSLNFPNDTAHCAECQADFPIENAAAYRVETPANKQPENITIEQTDDSMTMRYVPAFGKWALYGNMAAIYFCVLMFAGSYAFLVFAFVREGNIIGLIGVSVMILPMIGFIFFMFYNEYKALFCDWTIHLDANEVRLELRCKKHRKTIAIPRTSIVEACPNPRESSPFPMRFGRFPDFLWSRRPFGGHLLLADGTKHYLPLGTTDQHKAGEITIWMLTTINGFLAAHPASRVEAAKRLGMRLRL
jgi:hypothetical protein